MKRLIAWLLCGILLVSLGSCGTERIQVEPDGGIHSSSGDLYPEEFLYLDGEAVPFAEFRYYYLNYRNEYLSEDPDYFSRPGSEEALKEEILRCLKESYAVRFLAEEYDVSLTKAEREAVLQEVEQSLELYGGEEAMRESYLSRSLFHLLMESASLHLKLFNTLFEEGGEMAWSNEEFFAYYREHYLAVQEIYFAFPEGENAEHCPTTLQKAEEILAKARAGEDFWTLLERHGEDEQMPDYPEGLYLTEGQAEDTLWNASKALAIGEISEPVIGKSGVYLIRRMELLERKMLDNKETALFGYYDTFNEWHNGAYDDVFYQLCEERAHKIRVEYGSLWQEVSSSTVY